MSAEHYAGKGDRAGWSPSLSPKSVTRKGPNLNHARTAHAPQGVSRLERTGCEEHLMFRDVHRSYTPSSGVFRVLASVKVVNVLGPRVAAAGLEVAA
jgi:hypothetical protein